MWGACHEINARTVRYRVLPRPHATFWSLRVGSFRYFRRRGVESQTPPKRASAAIGAGASGCVSRWHREFGSWVRLGNGVAASLKEISGAASGCCSGSHFSIIKRGWRQRTLVQLARYHRVLRQDECVGLCIERLVKKINMVIAHGYVSLNYRQADA
ncbi:hypothetical protein D3C72_1707520 [compost metagenome]